MIDFHPEMACHNPCKEDEGDPQRYAEKFQLAEIYPRRRHDGQHYYSLDD